MRLVLIESSILLENYVAQVCCSRVTQYLKENQPDCIAIANLDSQTEVRWQELKANCPFDVSFFDQQNIDFQFQSNQILLSENKIEVNGQEIIASQGAAILIDTTPVVRCHYLVLDMLSDKRFVQVHQRQQHLQKLPIIIVVQMTNTGTIVRN